MHHNKLSKRARFCKAGLFSSLSCCCSVALKVYGIVWELAGVVKACASLLCLQTHQMLSPLAPLAWRSLSGLSAVLGTSSGLSLTVSQAVVLRFDGAP